MKEEKEKVKRYYWGVDWSDEFHQVWVSDPEGKKVMEKKVLENVDGLAEFGRWLDESLAKGIELWAAIEKPAGRIVDSYLENVEQNNFKKIYRAKTPRRKVKYSSISPNLACFASLRESSSF